MPVRDVGDAAPYREAGCSIKIYNVQQGKVHGTMQASSPTIKFRFVVSNLCFSAVRWSIAPHRQF